MRQKFEFNGDGVDLILTSAKGDLLRVPLGSLMAMTTLNDGELVRFSHQPPPADPYDPAAPLPPRRHVRVLVEETPLPEQVDAVALVQDDDQPFTMLADPAAATRNAQAAAGNAARLITDRADGPVGRHLAAVGTPVRETTGECPGHYDEALSVALGASPIYCDGRCDQ